MWGPCALVLHLDLGPNPFFLLYDNDRVLFKSVYVLQHMTEPLPLLVNVFSGQMIPAGFA